MRRIIVGVDESEGAAGALRWAAREAQVRDATVTAVLAWGFLQQHPDTGFRPDYTDEDASAALDAIVANALKPELAARVERRPVCGLPAEVLLDEAAGADLLVLGARGLGGFRGLLLGSVSRRCLHQATIPTVIVREDGERAPVGSIVVGVDGSESARRALAWAADAARLHRSGLVVVHAYQPPAVAGYPYATVSIDLTVLADAARQTIEREVAAVDTAGLDVRPVVDCGSASHALLTAAEDADLVVVGTRGLGAFKRALLGSVADQVAQHAPCPVAVIPDPS